MREGARTRIESRPAFALGDLVVIDPHQPAAVHSGHMEPGGRRWRRDARWRSDISCTMRHRKGPLSRERGHTASPIRLPAIVRRLMNDPFVEHTRSSSPESVWQRVTRTVPLTRARLLPGLRDRRNGSAFLYYLLTWLPVVGALMIVLQRGSSADDARMERARIAALLTFCLALNIFILRDPVGARIGGMAGPAADLVRVDRRASHASLGGKPRPRSAAGVRGCQPVRRRRVGPPTQVRGISRGPREANADRHGGDAPSDHDAAECAFVGPGRLPS